MPDFGLFGLEFENSIVAIEIRALKFFHCQILCKNKTASIWDQKCLIFVLLYLKLSHLIFFSKGKVLSKNENSYI